MISYPAKNKSDVPKLAKCPTGKRRFRGRLEAMQQLARNQKRGRQEQDYYKCKHCGWWHLTSQHRSTIGMKWSGVRLSNRLEDS